MGKAVRCQHRAFIDWKRMAFPQYPRAVALLYCGLSKLPFSQMALETHFCRVENSSRMGREAWKGTVALHTYYFQPVMGRCSNMRKPALQLFGVTDPDGRGPFQVERPVPFQIRKPQSIISTGEKHLCIRFLKTRAKSERRASPLEWAKDARGTKSWERSQGSCLM